MLYDSLVILALLLIAAFLALPVTGGESQAFRDPVYTGFLLLPWYLYLAWCWMHGGQTLGMRSWRIVLCTSPGSAPLTWRRSLLRFLVALASGLLLGAGFFAALIDPERRCWHDRASGTVLRRYPRSHRPAQQPDHSHSQ